MSYDLHLFQPPPAADPLHAGRLSYDEMDDEWDPGPLDPGREAWKRALGERLLRTDAALSRAELDLPAIAAEEEITLAEARRRYRQVELESADGLHLVIYDDRVCLGVLYPLQGDAARVVWRHAWALLPALCAEGLAIYDPQLDRLLALDTDLDAVLDEYTRTASLFQAGA